MIWTGVCNLLIVTLLKGSTEYRILKIFGTGWWENGGGEEEGGSLVENIIRIYPPILWKYI